MGYYRITAKKWFQKSMGNTYHSCMVQKVSGTGKNWKSKVVGYEPFTYGYSDHYLNTAAGILKTTERELRKRISKQPENFVIFTQDVTRKKDL